MSTLLLSCDPLRRKFGHLWATQRSKTDWEKMKQSKTKRQRRESTDIPCIMCVQYRGGCSVPWGVFSTVGDIMSTVGGYHEYRGGISWVPWGVFSTVGGYHDKCGGISWVPWGVFSTVGGIMSTVGGYLEYRGGCSVPWGDIMMHVGGYHEYRGGCSVPWGDTILWNLSTVGGYHDACGGISWVPWGVFSTVGYSNNNWLFPPRLATYDLQVWKHSMSDTLLVLLC